MWMCGCFGQKMRCDPYDRRLSNHRITQLFQHWNLSGYCCHWRRQKFGRVQGFRVKTKNQFWWTYLKNSNSFSTRLQRSICCCPCGGGFYLHIPMCFSIRNLVVVLLYIYIGIHNLCNRYLNTHCIQITIAQIMYPNVYIHWDT